MNGSVCSCVGRCLLRLEGLLQEIDDFSRAAWMQININAAVSFWNSLGARNAWRYTIGSPRGPSPPPTALHSPGHRFVGRRGTKLEGALVYRIPIGNVQVEGCRHGRPAPRPATADHQSAVANPHLSMHTAARPCRAQQLFRAKRCLHEVEQLNGLLSREVRRDRVIASRDRLDRLACPPLWGSTSGLLLDESFATPRDFLGR